MHSTTGTYCIRGDVDANLLDVYTIYENPSAPYDNIIYTKVMMIRVSLCFGVMNYVVFAFKCDYIFNSDVVYTSNTWPDKTPIYKKQVNHKYIMLSGST